MALEILKQCEKELGEWPEELREDLADAIARADAFDAFVSTHAEHWFGRS